MNKIEEICQIAIKAGLITLKYHKNISSYEVKADQSEVTIADQESNDYICKELKNNFNIPIVSEEGNQEENLNIIKNSKEYFIIDPLDGTKNFIKGGNNYTINIAYIKDKKAELGFIYAPVKDELYYTKNNKSYKRVNNIDEEIKVSDTKNNIILLSTKREPEKTQIINWSNKIGLTIKEVQNISSSYKFCLIAQGKGDLYPRMVNICSWDIAAGDAIIKAAGGKVTDQEQNKEEISYKEINAPKFIAYNGNIIL